MTLPTIHSNGTSARCLAEGYADARIAVNTAAQQLSKVEFNARDYYVQGSQAWSQAVAERKEMFDALAEIHDKLFALESHCSEFIK